MTRLASAISRTIRREDPATPMIEGLEKAPTGISGLDEITHGGLPRGRPTLVCGGPGCGKSLLGIEFLIRGIVEFGENGVLITFEETADDIRKNVASLGFDLDKLVRQKKLAIDHIKINSQEIEENGEYDLEGIFIRLAYAMQSVGAKRVMLDTIELLFAGLTNQGILRAEIQRLFYWLKAQGMTTVITGERGEGALTRQGLEEYVSDCVILLDHRVVNQISTRRLRVVKYRGTTHGTNEYPFLIDESGLSVLPITSYGLDHIASDERVSTGVERLDGMLGGEGLFRGSSVMITGTPGTGKSTLSAHMADASCRRGEQCVYFAFEESRHQIIRNMRSVGLDLDRHVKSGLLHFFNARPTLHGLETHLATMHKRIREFQPAMVVVDPVTNLISAGSAWDAQSMLIRLIDFLKSHQITGVFTSLTSGTEERNETSNMAISSLMDTWLLLRDIELGGERNRGLYVLKSRGMRHSNQIREFRITPEGIRLDDVYVGPEGVLTGSMRVAQEAREKALLMQSQQELERKRLDLDRKRQTIESRIAGLREELETESRLFERESEIETLRIQQLTADQKAMAMSRHADTDRTDKGVTGGQVQTKRRGTPRKEHG